MKKGKILSAFTSLAIAGTMLASALPFTASAATTVQTDLQLSMTSDKTSYTLDEIKAGATARVYVKADGNFEADNITSLGARFKSSNWDVRAKNLEIGYHNQIANNKGDGFSSFYSVATFGEWTKDFPIDQDKYDKTNGKKSSAISYAVKAKTAITDTNMPSIQIISNKNIGYFKKGTGSSIAEFDVEFPTDLEAGTYSIDFADVQLPVCIDDYGHLGDGIVKSTKGITFTIGDGQSATTATTKATTATTKATAATTKATSVNSGTGIVLDRDYTGTIKLSAEKVSAKAGASKVAVKIYADTNGFTIENLTFMIKYDSSKLKLNSDTPFEEGYGIDPGSITFEPKTNVYLFLINGDTVAENDPSEPIGTLYFDVASDATGELPVEIVPGQGLAKIECLQHSESKNGLKKLYLDPAVTNGAVVIGGVSTTIQQFTTSTTKSSITTAKPTVVTTTSTTKLTSNTKPTTAKTTVKSTSSTSGTGIVLDRDYTGTIKLSVEKVSAKAGDSKVAVNIYADTNGFTIENLTFKLEYDSSKLKLNASTPFKEGYGLDPGSITFEPKTNVYLFLINGDTVAENDPSEPIGTVYFDVASDATGELPVKIVPGQGLAKIECLQHSESKNGLKKLYLDPEVTDGAVVIGSSSSDDLTVEVDDSALDTKGDNINWYFADEAEFDKSNITVMSGDKDVTADATIEFDSTPGKTYNGKTFDYTVSYTATYGGKTANGTVDVKIGLRGDADCSHKVDARDAAAIAKDLAQLYGSKKTTLTKKNGEFALFLANVDEGVAKKKTTWYGKRDINARDAARIAEYLSKKFKNPNLELVDLVKK